MAKLGQFTAEDVFFLLLESIKGHLLNFTEKICIKKKSFEWEGQYFRNYTGEGKGKLSGGK